MEPTASAQSIDTLLLLGLPASGKSVVGRLLTSDKERLAELGVHVGPTIHLDDFPYVRFMWRICEIVESMGHDPVFLEPDGLRFRDPREWGTLIHLLNEDYAALGTSGHPATASSPGEWIVGRLERAHVLAGMSSSLVGLEPRTRRALSSAVRDEAESFVTEYALRRRPPGSTVVMEFARGGPDGAVLPLEPPYGYAHAFSLLSPDILRRAVALYVHVTPEESRERNRQRAEPSADGTVLHHAVPEAVMSAYYGIDDMRWLIDNAERPGTVTVRAHDSTFHLPVMQFDNRREFEPLRRSEPMIPGSELDDQVYAALRRAVAGLAASRVSPRSAP